MDPTRSLLALVLLSGKSMASPEPEGMSARFGALADAFVKEELALSPVGASDAGYHVHPGSEGKPRELDAELDDWSPEAVAGRRAFCRSWAERFRRETPPSSLGSQDTADFALISDQIALMELGLDKIERHRYDPTFYVELIGNGLFLPLTQGYAPKDVRVNHALLRLAAIPRLLAQAKKNLSDADPIFVKVAREENDGNISLVKETLLAEIPEGSSLRAAYDRAAPPAIGALQDFSRWLEEDLGKRRPSRTWRFGKDLYREQFRYVLNTDADPETVLAQAEADLKSARAAMLELAVPLHRQMFPSHPDHTDLSGHERENRIIGEVLDEIGKDHSKRDALLESVGRDLDGIKEFIRQKKIVSLSDRDNLKVIPTPSYMRGIYSVAGFHGAPSLEPKAEAQYWVTPIDPQVPDARAESRLREYNNWVLKWLTIHEALPGHYVQAEHANNILPENRRLVRNLFGNGAYVEGWAEYIADVMTDAGFLGGDPRFRISREKIRLRVITNAILDIRMHTMGMTDQAALELMKGEAFQTDAEAEGKLQRAKLSAAQLPTYYVGTKGWWALRRKYEAARGPSFDMRAFHDRALDQGALPLPLLEKLLLQPSDRP